MKIKKAFLVKVSGEIERQPQIENKEISLKEMYSIIGCEVVEHVKLKQGVSMWCDEEGLYRNPQINKVATKFYRGAYPNALFPGELTIVGNVIITDNTKAGNFIN